MSAILNMVKQIPSHVFQKNISEYLSLILIAIMQTSL